MSRLILIAAISIAVAINVIVWIEEFRRGKVLVGILDVFGTYFLVQAAGGGTYFTAGALIASLAISWYLNTRFKGPNLNQIIEKFMERLLYKLIRK